MPDILKSAQTQIDDAASQISAGSPSFDPPVPPPLLKEEAILPPTTSEVPVMDNQDHAHDPILKKLDLPFSSHAKEPSDLQKAPVMPEDPAEPPPIPPSVKRQHYKPALVAILLFLIATLPLGAYFVSQQKQLADMRSKAAYVTTESKLYIANLDKTSFSVVWKESLPSKGCAMAINATTKKEIKKCDASFANMHLVTLTGLDPYLSHTVSAQGAQNVLLHPFFGDTVITGLFDETKPLADVYKGAIITTNGKPFQGGFVIATPVLSDRFYFPIAAKTDSKGEYQLDFSLIDAQNPSLYDAYLFEIVDRMGKTLKEEKILMSSISSSLIPPVTVNPE